MRLTRPDNVQAVKVRRGGVSYIKAVTETAARHQFEADLFWPYTATAEKTVTRHQFEADLF